MYMYSFAMEIQRWVHFYNSWATSIILSDVKEIRIISLHLPIIKYY